MNKDIVTQRIWMGTYAAFSIGANVDCSSTTFFARTYEEAIGVVHLEAYKKFPKENGFYGHVIGDPKQLPDSFIESAYAELMKGRHVKVESLSWCQRFLSFCGIIR